MGQHYDSSHQLAYARYIRLRTNGRYTVTTNYNVIVGKSEALIRINFMIGTFHQPKSNPHKKATSTETEKCVSESIPHVLR